MSSHVLPVRERAARPRPAGRVTRRIPGASAVLAASTMLLGCGSVDESSGLIGSGASVSVFINELMSSNDAYYPDSQGETSDWIELFNAGDEPINLDGYFIGDNLDNPREVRLSEAVEIPANGVLVLRANSNASGGDPLTVPLGLSAAEGDSVVLTDAHGVLVDAVTFGPSSGGESYARHPDGSGPPAWCGAPTPSELNSEACAL